jgi:exosortase
MNSVNAENTLDGVNAEPGNHVKMTKLIFSERWRLATLFRGDIVQLFFAAVIVGMLYVLFQFLGNTVEDVNSRSAFTWMVARWGDTVSYGADYSHGWLIPFVSLGVLWVKRRKLIDAPKAINNWGLAVIVLALLMHWVGAKMQQTRISLFALIMLLWGTPFYFMGWKVAKVLIFPCAYLIFCIPLTFLDSMSLPLRMGATRISAFLLNGIGIEAVRSGSAIYSTAGGGFSFDVADPCSGLRSLLAMTAVAAVYAYFTQKTLVKQWILFAASIPLAIAGNVARIVTIALVAEAFGEKLASGLYHSYSTYIFFPVAIIIMIGLGALMQMNVPEIWRKLRHKMLTPTPPPGSPPLEAL